MMQGLAKASPCQASWMVGDLPLLSSAHAAIWLQQVSLGHVRMQFELFAHFFLTLQWSCTFTLLWHVAKEKEIINLLQP